MAQYDTDPCNRAVLLPAIGIQLLTAHESKQQRPCVSVQAMKYQNYTRFPGIPVSQVSPAIPTYGINPFQLLQLPKLDAWQYGEQNKATRQASSIKGVYSIGCYKTLQHQEAKYHDMPCRPFQLLKADIQPWVSLPPWVEHFTDSTQDSASSDEHETIGFCDSDSDGSADIYNNQVTENSPLTKTHAGTTVLKEDKSVQCNTVLEVSNMYQLGSYGQDELKFNITPESLPKQLSTHKMPSYAEIQYDVAMTLKRAKQQHTVSTMTECVPAINQETMTDCKLEPDADEIQPDINETSKDTHDQLRVSHMPVPVQNITYVLNYTDYVRRVHDLKLEARVHSAGPHIKPVTTAWASTAEEKSAAVLRQNTADSKKISNADVVIPISEAKDDKDERQVPLSEVLSPCSPGPSQLLIEVEDIDTDLPCTNSSRRSSIFVDATISHNHGVDAKSVHEEAKIYSHAKDMSLPQNYDKPVHASKYSNYDGTVHRRLYHNVSNVCQKFDERLTAMKRQALHVDKIYENTMQLLKKSSFIPVLHLSSPQYKQKDSTTSVEIRLSEDDARASTACLASSHTPMITKSRNATETNAKYNRQPITLRDIYKSPVPASTDDLSPVPHMSTLSRSKLQKKHVRLSDTVEIAEIKENVATDITLDDLLEKVFAETPRNQKRSPSERQQVRKWMAAKRAERRLRNEKSFEAERLSNPSEPLSKVNYERDTNRMIQQEAFRQKRKQDAIELLTDMIAPIPLPLQTAVSSARASSGDSVNKLSSKTTSHRKQRTQHSVVKCNVPVRNISLSASSPSITKAANVYQNLFPKGPVRVVRGKSQHNIYPPKLSVRSVVKQQSHRLKCDHDTAFTAPIIQQQQKENAGNNSSSDDDILLWALPLADSNRNQTDNDSLSPWSMPSDVKRILETKNLLNKSTENASLPSTPTFSTGSIASNIDWELVDTIIADVT